MRNKRFFMVVGILAALWTPAVLILRPGWGSILLFMIPVMVPVLLIPLAPLLINRRFPGSKIPVRDAWLQSVFYVAWLSIGFFFVNGEKGEESSLFTSLVQSPGVNASHALLELSGVAMFGCVFLSVLLMLVVLLSAVLRREWRQGVSKK